MQQVFSTVQEKHGVPLQQIPINHNGGRHTQHIHVLIPHTLELVNTQLC